jgi:hypothetical protein
MVQDPTDIIIPKRVRKQISLKSCNSKSRKAQMMFKINQLMNELLFFSDPNKYRYVVLLIFK